MRTQSMVVPALAMAAGAQAMRGRGVGLGDGSEQVSPEAASGGDDGEGRQGVGSAWVLPPGVGEGAYVVTYACSAMIEGLKPATTYAVRCRAANAAGWGRWTGAGGADSGAPPSMAALAFRTPAAVPAVPPALFAAAHSSASLRVRWGRARPNGSPVSKYQLQLSLAPSGGSGEAGSSARSTDGGSRWVSVALRAAVAREEDEDEDELGGMMGSVVSSAARTGSAAALVLVGLPCATAYRVRVRCRNAVGWGAYCRPVVAATLAAAAAAATSAVTSAAASAPAALSDVASKLASSSLPLAAGDTAPDPTIDASRAVGALLADAHRRATAREGAAEAALVAAEAEAAEEEKAEAAEEAEAALSALSLSALAAGGLSPPSGRRLQRRPSATDSLTSSLASSRRGGSSSGGGGGCGGKAHSVSMSFASRSPSAVAEQKARAMRRAAAEAIEAVAGPERRRAAAAKARAEKLAELRRARREAAAATSALGSGSSATEAQQELEQFVTRGPASSTRALWHAAGVDEPPALPLRQPPAAPIVARVGDGDGDHDGDGDGDGGASYHRDLGGSDAKPAWHAPAVAPPGTAPSPRNAWTPPPCDTRPEAWDISRVAAMRRVQQGTREKEQRAFAQRQVRFWCSLLCCVYAVYVCVCAGCVFKLTFAGPPFSSRPLSAL